MMARSADSELVTGHWSVRLGSLCFQRVNVRGRSCFTTVSAVNKLRPSLLDGWVYRFDKRSEWRAIPTHSIMFDSVL